MIQLHNMAILQLIGEVGTTLIIGYLAFTGFLPDSIKSILQFEPEITENAVTTT